MMKIRAYQQCLTDQVSNCDLEQLGVHVERMTVGDGRNGRDGSVLTNMQVVGDGLFAQRIQPSTDVANAVSDQNAFQPSRQLIQGFDVPYVDICEIHSGQDERARDPEPVLPGDATEGRSEVAVCEAATH